MKLDINGDIIEHPSAGDIERALAARPEGDALLVFLVRDEQNQIEAETDNAGGFRVAYAEGGEVFDGEDVVSRDDLIDMLQLYARGDRAWRTRAKWLRYVGPPEEDATPAALVAAGQRRTGPVKLMVAAVAAALAVAAAVFWAIS
jgi:hypothetical protein